MASRPAGAFIGPALLAKLVATKSSKSVDEIEPLLQSFEEVILSLLETGARVRVLGGYFEVIRTKATRRKSPLLEGRFVKVPAKKKIVFRESRKK
jgi:nucleoid DNA-binding protein